MDNTRKRRNAYKGNVSCRAWPTIRNTRAYLGGWSALDDQFEGKGIEDYLTKNVDWCSEVQVVILNNMDDPSGSSHISCWKSAAVVTSEYGEIDGCTGAMQDEIFSNKELLACFFHELSSKTINMKRKSAKTRGDIQNSDKFTNQACLNKQINCSKENVVHTDFLQKLPTRVLKPFRERRQNQSQTGNENGDIPTKVNNLGVYTTCPTHVYAFRRGLVSSKDAQNLELINSNRRAHPTLPPVFADRVGKTPDVKQYRLTLESDVRKQKNLQISKHYPPGSPETCTGSEKEQSMEPKLVISRIFSAEKVIPVACSKRRYFDFQSYIDFLYKERKNRRHTNGACNSGGNLVSK